MRTKIVFVVSMITVSMAAQAARANPVTTVSFNDGNVLNVLGDYGSGADTAYLVVDLNSAGPDYAWQFNWDPSTTVNGWQMLEDIAGNSVLSTNPATITTDVTNSSGDANLTITATYYTSFAEHLINNMQYGPTLGTPSEWDFYTGTYSLASVSGADPQGMTWKSISVGIDDVNLTNNEFIGWVDVSPHAPKPTLPEAVVPEPGCFVLFLLAPVLRRNRRRA